MDNLKDKYGPRRAFNILKGAKKPEPEYDGETVTLPKIDRLQEGMIALELCIQDHIVGITPELALKHLSFHPDEATGMMVTAYKGKPVILSGFRQSSIIGGAPEFYLAQVRTISA